MIVGNRRIKPNWLWAVFIIYLAILVAALLHHEPWGDEAQSWLLARDASLYDLFVHYLRYEGSPGLWQLILMLPAKLNFPYITLQITSLIFASIGMYVWLRYAPFPKIIKMILPFSFYFLYQYAVVARSYAMFPLALFMVGVFYKDRLDKPYIYFTLIGFLAFVSLHGTFLAVGLWGSYIYDCCKSRHWLNGVHKRKYIFSNIVFLFLLGVIALILWVPKDYFNLNRGFFHLTIAALYQNFFIGFGDALCSNMLFFKTVPWREIFLLPTAMIVWYLSFKFFYKAGTIIVSIITILPLSILLFSINYIAPWHLGTLFSLWIFLLWISWDTAKVSEVAIEFKNLKKWMVCAIVLVLVLQVKWSYNTLQFDFKNSYSGGRNVAEYIKENRINPREIYIKDYRGMAIAAYFNDPAIFPNLQHNRRAFMVWTKKEKKYALKLSEILKGKPTLIIVPTLHVRGSFLTDSLLGYRFERIYNGGLYWKNRVYEDDTYLIYKKEKVSGEHFDYLLTQRACRLLDISFNKSLLKRNPGKIRGSW